MAQIDSARKRASQFSQALEYMIKFILKDIIVKYQASLDAGFRNLTNLCGMCGVILGMLVGYCTIKYLSFPFEIDFSKGDEQFSYPLLVAVLLLIYFGALFFICAFVCHLPFVVVKKITLQEAFQAVFMIDHPSRWKE